MSPEVRITLLFHRVCCCISQIPCRINVVGNSDSHYSLADSYPNNREVGEKQTRSTRENGNFSLL